MNSQPKLNLSELEQSHSQDIHTIMLLLAKISQRSPSETFTLPRYNAPAASAT